MSLLDLKKRLPELTLTFGLLLVCAGMGHGWLGRGPSDEELIAATARYGDVLRGIVSTGGLCWWTPNFLNGHSLAGVLTVWFGPSVVLFPLLAQGLAPWMDALAAYKLGALAVVFGSGWSMFALAKQVTGSGWRACFAGLLYATMPQWAVRLATLEHVAFSVGFVFPPLVFPFLLKLSERASWRDSLLLAMSVSGLALAYTKLLILFLPALGFFFFALALRNPGRFRVFAKSCLLAAAFSIPLGVVPLLPALREAQWMGLFDLQPFEIWQKRYAFYSAVSWLDYGNFLTAGSKLTAFDISRHPNMDFQIGAGCLVAILAGLALLRRATPGEAFWLRVFTGLMFFSLWLSCGTRSIFGAHVTLLQNAAGASSWLPPMAWASLALQAGMLWRLVPEIRRRGWIFATLLTVYFFVPGFRILELLPVFQNVRAPSAVWAITGGTAFVMSAVVGLGMVFGRLKGRFFKGVLAASFALLFVADALSTNWTFYRPGLPEETLRDFRAAMDFLKSAPQPGGVMAYSSRYFYLLIPGETGRPLVDESLALHFEPKWRRWMRVASMTTPAGERIFFDLNGVSFLLIDKGDPLVRTATLPILRSRFPVAYQNNHFEILANETSKAPGFFISPHSPLRVDSIEDAALAVNSILRGEMPGDAPVEPDDKPHLETPLRSDRGPETRQHFVLEGLPSRRGLAVATMNYHPDWTAEGDSGPLKVCQAAGNLLAAQVTEADTRVEFQFRPPWWYGTTLLTPIAAWLLAMFALLGTEKSRVLTHVGGWVSVIRGCR